MVVSKSQHARASMCLDDCASSHTAVVLVGSRTGYGLQGHGVAKVEQTELSPGVWSPEADDHT